MNRSRKTGDLVSQNNLFVDITNDRIGIGSTVPGNKLSLPDSAKIGLGNAEDLTVVHDGNNSTISNSTGGLYLQSDTNINIDSKTGSHQYIHCQKGAEVSLWHNNSKKLETTSGGINVTGTVTCDGSTHDGDVTFTGASYNLLWDKSDNALKFSDNALAYFGSDNDLVMHHTGSTGYIKNTTGTLYIQDDSSVIIGKVTGSHTGMKFIGGGALELYHNNNLKLATTSAGISITGNNVVSGNITAVDATFSGNVSIGKTLTYEDVKNIDSVGVVTARSGFEITSGTFKANSQVGAAGSVLGSTGSGVNWISPLTGPQGAQGAQGHQGVQGAQGHQGVQGAQGHQGVQGAQGRQGAAGVAGAQGAQGATGSSGGTGAQGVQGAQGHQGVQGAVGAQGNQGVQGATGSTGSTGAQGHQGVQGAQGATGSTGSTGSTGAQGHQGVQGASDTTTNASVLSSGTVAAARLPQQELGKSIVGNFGQWQGHNQYSDANVAPAYWGWNYIAGSTNCPNSTSSQWYRNRVALSNSHGFGSDSGDYWLEMAYPRYSHGTAGQLWIRSCENGVEGGWSEVGTVPSQTINTKTITLKAGYTLRRSDHHTGHLEGSYNNVGNNATKTNPIYTIGSSYNPTSTALSNMYGIGYTKGSSTSFLTGLPGQANSWGMYVASDGDARIFLDGSLGHINAGGHLYCDRVYVDKQTTRYLSDVSGDYGSIQINGGGSGNWEGFSIDGRVVFMHDGGSGSGIYDDVNEHWLFYAVHNSYVELRHTNNTRIRTSTAGVSVYDSVQLEGGKIRRTNHHTGHLEGSYNNVGANSAKSNPIYTIGSNYNPTDAGLSNMYGIGYTHGDATFTPTGASWGMYVAADGDARVYLDAGNGRVYIGTAGNRYISQVTGNYGTFQCNSGGAGSWQGWSIDGRAVFMHDGGSGTGIFNDVDNHWIFYATHGGNSEMRCNNTARITADNSGAVINGRITCSGTSSFDNVTLNYNMQTTQRGRFTTSTSAQNSTNCSALAGTPGTLSYAFGYQEASTTSNGGWSNPYPNMVLGYHTGIQIGGHTSYGGTRFYSDHPSRTTSRLFSIGEGDSNTRVYANFLPSQNNHANLGSSSLRFANLYVNDLQLSNEAKKETGGNDVDGTWGDWTLQEGEDNIYMINNRTGKKYKMNLTEVS